MDVVVLDEGKYSFYVEDDSLYCVRYGEKWRSFVGDNAVFSLFYEALDLEAKNTAQDKTIGEVVMALQKFVAQYELGSALDIPGYLSRIIAKLEVVRKEGA